MTAVEATVGPRLVELADFRDRHRGETIVVCGCGESLNDLRHPERFVTIGVNDVGRLFEPTYLVVLNARRQFTGDRFRYVEASRAEYLFTQLDLGIPHPRIVTFRLGRYGGTTFTDPGVLHYTRNSPYVAVCLAAHMGAARIVVIGVDFTDRHFFAPTGRHALAAQLRTIDAEYRRLGDALRERGIEVVNASRVSRLTAFPRAALDERPADGRAGAAPLSIVSYATTPVAGVPAVLARCIAARTPHRARCVWADNGYGNGVTFDGDIEWRRAPAAAEAALADADLVIVHNGKVDPAHERLLAGKPVVTMAHNYGWNVDQRFVARGFPGVVVGQYQATLPEFREWHVVPNPVPLWEPAYAAGAKPPVITIAYTPSGRHERYPESHRLYWHGKGYVTTMRVLTSLASRHGVGLAVPGAAQVSHAESLALKRRAHVVIDECVTGSYHRNSLEGLAAGSIVVNGVGRLPGVVDVLRRCAPGAADAPFVSSTLEALEETLAAILARGADALRADGLANRAWLERHWDFASQWTRFWWPAVAEALARAGPPPPRVVAAPAEDRNEARRRTAMNASSTGVSVVVPHGGADRLPHLRATLVSLRQCEGVGEVIVAEMGRAPVAEELAERWADKYVFVREDGPFERARTLNVGTGIAERDFVLWKDNDLLAPGPFIARAAAELRERHLDYLIPYTSVRYLSAEDSEAVMRGVRDPAACTPTTVLYSARTTAACSGGTGLVRRSFVVRFGGLLEGFRGWGGEDNAWNRKARLLGRFAATSRQDQHVYHLFHPGSGGYAATTAMAQNPHYAANVALLQKVASLRDARAFLAHFPPPAHQSCPWPADRPIALVTAETDAAWRPVAAQVAQALAARYGASVSTVHLAGGDTGDGALDGPAALVFFGPTLAARLEHDATPPPIRARAVTVTDRAGDAAGTALALIRPLSLVLGGAPPRNGARHRAHVGPASLPAAPPDDVRTLPVWTYWEGPCPDWVEACRRTIGRHAPTLRALTPQAFDALRDRDRDIDLTRLHVVHRADFIRAFLLARYGGVWVDADCLVMQSLEPILASLTEHEFVGHRERSGYVSNGFMAARPDSRIAAALYDRVCRTLRSRQPLGWMSLGGGPLTEIVDASPGAWHELPCERIQPVCWSDPAAFFERGDAARHERRFDPRAYCYMLSNTEIRKHQANGGSGSLLDPDTFFTFLLNRSLGRGSAVTAAADEADADGMERIFAGMVEQYRAYGDESLSGPGSCLARTAELRARLPLVLEDLGVRSLLDAACGDFNWMSRVALGVDTYLGVDVLAGHIAANQRRHGSPRRQFTRLDIRTDPLPRADCILCRDCLVHFSFADVFRAIANFKASGAQHLLTTTFTRPRPNRDTSGGAWRTLNLELPPFGFPKPLRLIDERCTEAGGAYADKSLGLWRLADLPEG